MHRLVVIACLAALAGGCERKVAGGTADGPTVYSEACARCHGENGVPDAPLRAQLGVADLTDPELQKRLSDADIANRIRHGSEDKRMPAMGAVLTDEQIDALVTHVRSFAAD